MVKKKKKKKKKLSRNSKKVQEQNVFIFDFTYVHQIFTKIGQ